MKTGKAGKTAILVVSFGTDYQNGPDVAIGAIENSIAKKFPDYEVRRAFTSRIIIKTLKVRNGLKTENVEEALIHALEDGITNLVVQPTYLTDGYENRNLANILSDYKDKFHRVVLGEPLLTDDEDFEAVVKAITDKTASYRDGKTVVCFMGHGTRTDANIVYKKLQETLRVAGFPNYYIATMKADPTLNQVIASLKQNSACKKVILQPLMVVAGYHANNEMAGNSENSWKMILEKEGYEVECFLEGLGQNPKIQELYVKHTQAAVERLRYHKL